jgi:hypothetical protein
MSVDDDNYCDVKGPSPDWFIPDLTLLLLGVPPILKYESTRSSRSPPRVDYIISVLLTHSHCPHSDMHPTESPNTGYPQRIQRLPLEKVSSNLFHFSVRNRHPLNACFSGPKMGKSQGGYRIYSNKRWPCI